MDDWSSLYKDVKGIAMVYFKVQQWLTKTATYCVSIAYCPRANPLGISNIINHTVTFSKCREDLQFVPISQGL
jgi:hypothetical protein